MGLSPNGIRRVGRSQLAIRSSSPRRLWSFLWLQGAASSGADVSPALVIFRRLQRCLKHWRSVTKSRRAKRLYSSRLPFFGDIDDSPNTLPRYPFYQKPWLQALRQRSRGPKLDFSGGFSTLVFLATTLVFCATPDPPAFFGRMVLRIKTCWSPEKGGGRGYRRFRFTKTGRGNRESAASMTGRAYDRPHLCMAVEMDIWYGERLEIRI